MAWHDFRGQGQGQFLTLDVSVGGKQLKRAYTMTSHPCDAKMLEIIIKREEEGVVSSYMCDSIHPGDLLDVQASFGKLTFSPTEASALVLVGGGVGITPLISVLRCLLHCGCDTKIYLFYSITNLPEYLFRDELEALAKNNPNLKIHVALTRSSELYPGAIYGHLTAQQILERVPDLVNARVHLCGPSGMIEGLSRDLQNHGVPADHIKTEGFGTP